MRIYRNRFYVLGRYPGISGFQDFDRMEYCIVTGAKAQLDRCAVVGEYLPIGEDWHRVQSGAGEDGRTAGVMRTPDALAWLTSHPFAALVRLDPATRSQDVRPHWEVLT